MNNIIFSTVSKQWNRSLSEYYCDQTHRYFTTTSYTLLVSIFTFAAMKLYDFTQPFMYAPAYFMAMYTWAVVLIFGLCHYITDEWLSRLMKGWGNFKGRTVGKTFLIWFLAFVMAFTIERAIVHKIIVFHFPFMIYTYKISPEIRPPCLQSFLYCFFFWLFIVIPLLQIAIRRQNILEGQIVYINKLLKKSEKNWRFPHNNNKSIQSNSYFSDQNEKPLIQTEFSVPTKHGDKKIDCSNISHITVEDHYCRIFMTEEEKSEEFFIKMSLKEILSQLPQKRFLQIHRSHVVNICNISRLIKKNRSLYLILNHKNCVLPISRYRLPQIRPELQSLSLDSNLL